MSRKVGVLVGAVLLVVLGISFLSCSEEALRVYQAGEWSVLLITNTTERTSNYVVIMFDQAVTLEHVYAFGGGETVELKDLLADVVSRDGESKAGTYWGIRFEKGSGLVPCGTLQVYFSPAGSTVMHYHLN